MNPNSISPLWPEVWNDLQSPDVLWQLGAILLCVAISWLLARILRPAMSARDRRKRLVQLGVESFAPVLWPLLALLLVFLAKPVLANWHQVNLLRLAIPLIGSFALIRLAFYVLHRVFARGGASPMLLMSERIFAVLVWIGFALYITGFLPQLMLRLDSVVLPIGSNRVSILAIAQAAVFVAITVLLALWAAATLEDRLMRVDTMHTSLRAVLARMGKALLLLVAVLISLSSVGIDLTVLSVFGGAFGIGLGLGLQKIVSNYVSGFVILLERSLTIGDVVNVDKFSGRVTQINTRYTVIRSHDGIETVIPNEMLLSNPVQNHSLTDRSVRLTTRVTVDYQTDIDSALQLLIDTANGVNRVSKTLPTVAFLITFGADGLELELGFWIEDPENGRANVLSEVNRAVLRALQQAQIKIPYPQREIRLIDKDETLKKPVLS